ncbi:unnamed protein product [Leptidea sinapis]|uniref:Uncharacterized protein n=1 Tax=Leptidea sinapis TaxID=189913 RepID=A0A5E4PL25_9NEOP|nr:unnamed protein product [Leptidea sinapis]
MLSSLAASRTFSCAEPNIVNIYLSLSDC